MLGWLTRLFGKRAQAESAAAGASPQPPADRLTASPPSASGGATGPHSVEATGSALLSPTDPTVASETREVCPTCGKTSVFAGPPGHRYCMHCALRQELFDASAAAHQ